MSIKKVGRKRLTLLIGYTYELTPVLLFAVYRLPQETFLLLLYVRARITRRNKHSSRKTLGFISPID
jgi:hypothetical protein